MEINLEDKIIHIWIDSIPKHLKSELSLTVNDTYQDIKDSKRIIHTTNTHFCSMDMIAAYGYKVCVHPTDKTEFYVHQGYCKPCKKELRLAHNIEKMLYAGSFGEVIKRGTISDEVLADKARAVGQLFGILDLKDNWNDNGAKAFTQDHVLIVLDNINNFKAIPEVFPTACDTIQLEYETDTAYLEIEVGEHTFTVYSKINVGTDKERQIIDLIEYPNSHLVEYINKMYECVIENNENYEDRL